MEKLIKSTNNLSNEELILLREKFIVTYSRKKGWDEKKLSPDQLLEIVQNPSYKNPGLILS